MKRIYLDHAASTPVYPEVVESMLPWLTSEVGNPSSLHQEGRRGKDALDQAREILSRAFQCEFGEIIFTSSGTESVATAILGTALAHRNSPRKRILFGAAEHHCVLETRETLESLDYLVETIPVTQESIIDLNWLAENLDSQVLLVSVQSANNETGALQPVQEIAQLCGQNQTLFHCDAVQTFGNPSLISAFPAATMISISAHKFGGPKGAGALYVKAGTKVKPLLAGGGQEREMRAGTENVAAIVGMATAVHRNLQDIDHTETALQARNAFERILEANPIWVPTIANLERSLPGHCHGRFSGISAESMLIRLDRLGIAASSGAACSSGSIQPSHVMKACGYSDSECRESLRFTFGWTSTAEEAVQAAERVLEAVTAVRSGSTK